MNLIWNERIRRFKPLILTASSIAVIGTALTFVLLAAPASVVVDFTKPVTTLAPYAFSGTISTYGNDGTIVASAQQRTNLANLGLGAYRIPLQYNGGNPISSAAGAGGGPSGDTWVAKIREIGAEPIVVLGGTADNNFSAQDAAGMVRHFSGANKVTYWVIGNEPDNQGISMDAYCAKFNQAADAMKAVDPNIKLIGPALTDYETYKYADYDKFLSCAGAKVDVVDFHDYGERTASLAVNIAEQSERYEAKIKDLRARIRRIVPNRAGQIGIQVGEWNLTPVADGDLDSRMYSGGTTVYGALVAGNIAKGGARGHQYADQNNPLGLTFETSSVASRFGRAVADPMPLYHGIGMFTGEKLFRGFGTQMVDALSQNPDVSVYASNNNKNIVLINKNETTAQTVNIDLRGFAGGSAEIWQTNKSAPFDPPARKGIKNITTQAEVTLPAWTVTTIVLTEGGAVTPTPAPTPAPSTPPTTPSPAVQSAPVRVNVGGGQYTDPSGNSWTADFGAIGGNTDNQALGRTIANTNAPQLYQDERWGNFSYRIPVAKGTYKVRLHFAEIYNACTVAGCRVFNVSAEGASWLTNYDIAAKVGANKAVIEEKTIVLDDSALDLAFTGIVGSPQLSAIEILNTDTGTPASVPTPTPASSASGLTATYFPNINLSGAGVTRVDPTINFNWGMAAPMAGIPADNFSVRWSGAVTAPATGTYTFYLTGDDGVRMWVDGKQVINGWKDQSSKEYAAKVAMTAGRPYAIKVEYYEHTHDAVVSLAWSGPTTGRQVVPVGAFATASSGLKATYYTYTGGGNFGPQVATDVSPVIDFNWGQGAPNATVGANRFGVVWTGKIVAPTSGQYAIATDSDDGVRVKINNQLIIDHWNDHSATRDVGSVTLNAGQAYDIQVMYYENFGDAVMRLLWKTPGQATYVTVPVTAMSH